MEPRLKARNSGQTAPSQSPLPTLQPSISSTVMSLLQRNADYNILSPVATEYVYVSHHPSHVHIAAYI